MADILLPELGEGITSVEISEVLVKKGDTVKVDDPIIVVETEKASMEIPTTQGGTVDSVEVEKGGTIAPGNVIISIDEEGETEPEKNEPEPEIVESINDEISETSIPKVAESVAFIALIYEEIFGASAITVISVFTN